MFCYPRCDVPLPEIGGAKVITAFEACQSPPELTIKIIHEVRSTSTFIARDAVVDSRNIGTEHWPLKLNVQFYEQKPDEYYVKACVVTERLNTATCFMNSTYSMEEIAQCGGPNGGAPLSLIFLSILLSIFAVFFCIGLVILIHRMILCFCYGEGRSRRGHKQSQLSSLIPANQRMEEDRLTVIEEEREDLPSPSDDIGKSSFYTFVERSQVIVCDPKPFMQSFKPQPEAV